MRICVDEIPLNEYDCPFSTEYESRIMDKRTKQYHSVLMYECSITKEQCDLNRDRCSGLRVIE